MQGFVWKMKTHIVLGYGCTNDAYHITSPREDGEAVAKAMQNAIQNAGITAGQMICIYGQKKVVGKKHLKLQWII